MSNRLINERSPYLREHSENPVDWYPWCQEAFDRAEREDKPIFLSIGYSTCHWCHVMAHESFENKETAELLNRGFISIKVDREERPDIDSVYMRVCQSLSGSAGWPMTIIMSPDKKPFFAGTYLPRENRGGQTGLNPLLRAVTLKWKSDRAALLKAGEDIVKYAAPKEVKGRVRSPEELIAAAAAQFEASYDSEYGGFGKAPKFPAAHNLIFLTRFAKLSGDRHSREWVENTLKQMYKGGIFDHFGGGFCRYSTDREWLAPHFEKTLYDNALLSFAYTEAWQDGHMALYRYVAESTLDYCLRELKSESGGFYCGQDADSQGVEGMYYTFTPAQVKSVLGEDEGRHFCECYDITEDGNFHKMSIPNLLLNTRWNLLPEGYADYRERMREYRQSRMSLAVDTKILTSWNGLMLMALSRAARAFSDRRYLLEARSLAEFMAENLGSPAELRACFYSDGAKYKAQLDDYVFYALGLLELYSADYEPEHISLAGELAEQILQRFADTDGGFYRTAQDAEKLIFRPKEIFDGAMPSGNSAAALLFSELWRLTAEEKWHEAAAAQCDFLCTSAGKYPAGLSFGICALLNEVYETKELVCVSPDNDIPPVLNTVCEKYAPELRILLKTPENAEALRKAAPFTADYSLKDGKAAFYICSGGSCSLPANEI